MNDKNLGKCVICGINQATTRDHVPPKNLFPKPRPQDLITVPACSKCNNGSSVEDEDFRTYLSFQIGKQHELTERLWLEGAKKSIERRTSFRKAFLDSIGHVDVLRERGIVEKRMSFLIPERIYQIVFERIVRGLYFYHFQKILGKDVSISITPLTHLDDKAMQMIENLKTYSIGDFAFVYKVGRANEDDRRSIWIMQLYEAHWVLGETGENLWVHKLWNAKKKLMLFCLKFIKKFL